MPKIERGCPLVPLTARTGTKWAWWDHLMLDGSKINWKVPETTCECLLAVPKLPQWCLKPTVGACWCLKQHEMAPMWPDETNWCSDNAKITWDGKFDSKNHLWVSYAWNGINLHQCSLRGLTGIELVADISATCPHHFRVISSNFWRKIKVDSVLEACPSSVVVNQRRLIY